MGYFFIALFGGIWLLLKIAREKNEAKRFDSNLNQELLRIDSVNNKYSDKHMKSLKTMLEDGSISVEEVYQAIKEDLIEVLGEDYKMKFPLPGVSEYNIINSKLKKISDTYKDAYDTVSWAELLWLSKQGKIRYQYYHSSLNWIPLGVRQMFNSEVPLETINRNMEFCKIIERNLRQNGVNITLVGMPGKNREAFAKDNSETRIAIYECLDESDKQKSKRLW